MKKLIAFNFILLVCILNFKLKAQLLPSIGLVSLPSNTTPICNPPYYLGSFYNSGFMIGDTVPDFKLYNLQGDSLILSDELSDGKPILLIAGSLTCPVFRNKVQTINQVVSTYGSAIKVFIIYTIEAHPTDTSVYFGTINITNQNNTEGVLFASPTNYGERKILVDTMSNWVNVNAPIFIDGPCNPWWNNFGPAPNNSYLIDTNGVVVSKHGWFHKQPTDNIFCDIDNYLSVTSSSCNISTSPGHFTVNVINSTSFGSPGETLYDFAQLINTQSVTTTVEIRKLQWSLPANWQTAFCADICYSAQDDSISLVLNPYDTLLFSLDFFTSATADSGKVRVGFRNVNNFNNSYSYWLKASTYPATGVEDNFNGNSDVLFYPNPCENYFNINTPDKLFDIFIYNSVGQLIDKKENTKRVDTSLWPSGYYIIHYRSNDLNFTKRLIHK